MKKMKFLPILLAATLIGSLALNIRLLRSTQQLNLDSLKWAVKLRFIKYEELKDGKIQLLKHENGGIEYSEFFEETQSKNQKELFKRIGPTYSIFGLAWPKEQDLVAPLRGFRKKLLIAPLSLN